MTYVLIGVASYLLLLAVALIVMMSLGRAARHADTLEAQYLAQTHGIAVDFEQPLQAPRRVRSVRGRASGGVRRLSRFAHLHIVP